ncbi:MAG TPA: phosphoglycerate mutase family protein [Terriglobales bacterium]|nr:phosphoglycerate mutase family protein [Terriglobales bacterium]
MTIYFLRHASAGEKKKDPTKDAHRALDRDGIEQAVRMGRVLAALESHLDAIFASPLKRAVQTAAAVANEMGFEGKIQSEPALAPDATYAAFQQMLAKHSGHDSILVVGHNPNLSQFLGRMLGTASHPVRVELRKGGMAKLVTGRPGAALHWLLTPKAVNVKRS